MLKLFKRDDPKPPPPEHDFWYQVIENWRTFAGQRVSGSSADRVAAVYACRTGISETIAMSPVQVFTKISDGEVRQEEDSDLQHVLAVQPNEYTDAFTWWETQLNQLLWTGNAYAQILRFNSGKGDVGGLNILQPERMTLKIDGNRLLYHYTWDDGSPQDFTPAEILHFRIDTADGILGKSPLQRSPEIIAIALALQSHTGALFENGAFFRGFVEAPHRFNSDDERKNFIDSIVKFMKSGKVALLEQGTKFNGATMDSNAAQLDELWRRVAIGIASLYHMPPHMIQMLEEGTSYASIEQQGINYVTYTILPWVKRLEIGMRARLIKNPKQYVKFNLSALLRGDLKSRTDAIVQQIQYGLATVNDGRKLLDLNAAKEKQADSVMVSHNLRPIDQPAPTAPAPAASPTKPPSDDTARFRPLFDEILGRAMRREISAVKTARKKENFQAWANGYYAGELRSYLGESLHAACFAAKIESEKLERFVEEYSRSRAETIVLGEELSDNSGTWVERLLGGNYAHSQELQH